MTNRRARARNRRAPRALLRPETREERDERLKELFASFEQHRGDGESLEALMKQIEQSDGRLWDIVRAVELVTKEAAKAEQAAPEGLNEDERAMLTQIANPALSGKTSGSVLRRLIAKKPPRKKSQME